MVKSGTAVRRKATQKRKPARFVDRFGGVFPHRSIATRRAEIAIFLRGFCIVTLVAWNVRHVSELQYGAAFVTGGLVSLVWFSNARTASLTTSNLGKWCYSAGAACGTVFGMWLGS